MSVAAALVLALPVGPAHAKTAINGSYVYAGGDAENRQRLAAIEDAVDEVFFLGRRIARGKLRDATRIVPRMTVRREGQSVELGYGERRYSLDIGAAPVTVRGRGNKKVRASVRETRNGVLVDFRTSKGGKRERLTLDAGGNLIVEIRLWGKRLPKPVEYQLTYRRIR